MNMDSAWRIISLALSLIGCTASWIACALSGGELLECVGRGVLFFAILWTVFWLLGALLRAFVISGRQE